LPLAATSAGTISLAAVADRLQHLEVTCNRCGRLSTRRLLEEHGNVSMPVLLETLSADCPRRQAMARGQIADVCGIHAPELAKVF
jgi:hypothetical protein